MVAGHEVVKKKKWGEDQFIIASMKWHIPLPMYFIAIPIIST